MSAKFKKFSNPEVLLLLLSIFYMILMIVISSIELKGVTLSPVAVTLSDGSRKELSYWAIALLSTILVMSVFFIVSLFRISVRKAKRTEQYGQKTSRSIFA